MQLISTACRGNNVWNELDLEINFTFQLLCFDVGKDVITVTAHYDDVSREMSVVIHLKKISDAQGFS